MNLLERRQHAARESGGISADQIHEAALAAVPAFEPGSHWLEYGAGTGGLLKRLLTLHPQVKFTGADLYPRPEGLTHEVAWECGDLNQSLNLPDASFDGILSTEVIEHLENPRAVAREWHRLLKPGGWVVMTTPNNRSLRSLLSLAVTGHFVAFQDSCYPAHITALVEKDLVRILKEAGFEPPVFSYTNEGGIPKMPHRKWQDLSGLLKGRWFSDNLVLRTRKPMVADGR
jgi:2-polyprenyl-3-methyl-5-hydroxy-6-metoxy-1,4-benzoquinol methylase